MDVPVAPSALDGTSAARTQKTTFGSRYTLPNFRHSFTSVRHLDERPRKETKWDIPDVCIVHLKRQLLPEADVQCALDRCRMTTETGLLSV